MTVRTPSSQSYFSQRLRLHYLDWGTEPSHAGRPPMLLVHGVQDHCHTWDWFAEAFAERYHIVAPDLRGHGDSEWARGSGYHHLDYLYDLDQLVRQRELAPAIVVSHSMGGTLAALYAGVFPDAVDALVIIEGVGFWPGWNDGVPAHERIAQWIDGTRGTAARSPRRYASLEEAYQRMQQANAHLTPERARHLTVHGSNQNEDGTYSWKYDNYTRTWPPVALSEPEIASLWQRIRCPVLIINGAEGFPHRIGQDGTLAHFRDAEQVSIPGAGHWVHHDRFDAVIEAVRGFLDRRYTAPMR